MYAVIFRAEINTLDEDYSKMAAQMREIALSEYGCIEFIAVTEGNVEVAISYWSDEDSIKLWKQDAKHLVAQEYGRNNWYKNYRVQVVKVVRDYSSL